MSKLDIISLGLIFFAVIVIVLGIVKIHCYPGKVAVQREHPQAKAIEVTSLLGLLIFPLWMFALIWAYSNAVIGKLYREEPKVAEKPPKPLPKFLGKHHKHSREEAKKTGESKDPPAPEHDAGSKKPPQNKP